MKKLSLKLDDLRVDSFNTTPGDRAGRGTVHGHDESQYSAITECESCDSFCYGTYWGTCGGCGDGTYRLSCPYCTGPYCQPGDPSYDSCYTGDDTTC